MSRKLFDCHGQFRHKIFVAALLVLCTTAVSHGWRDGSQDWIVLKNCTLIPNPANDGDSFHVSAGNKEYLFRLYFVDTPETDEMTPRRVIDQAEYFAITVPQAIELGRVAKEFTREKLSEPFTVCTHMADAMGNSRLERFYAFVQTREGDLGEQLVRDGLARVYGFKAAPPGLRSSRAEMTRLLQLEDKAKQEKIGGWGINAGRLNFREAKPSGSTAFVRSDEYLARAADAPASAVVSSTAQRQALLTRSVPLGNGSSHAKQNTALGQININTATEKELTTVPGIGHVMAARITAARPFRSADDLKRVSGIGDKKYAKIRPYFE